MGIPFKNTDFFLLHALQQAIGYVLILHLATGIFLFLKAGIHVYQTSIYYFTVIHMVSLDVVKSQVMNFQTRLVSY